MTKNISELDSKRDVSIMTRNDVDAMITDRLMQFESALVDRSQIKPIPTKSEWLNPGPVVEN